MAYNVSVLSILLFAISCSQFGSRHGADLCHLDGIARSTVFEEVSNGSTEDLRKTVASLSCLDGGDLEDAHIAIGIGLFRFPDRFAPVLSGQVDKNDLRAISIMLPARFVDESCKAVDELLRRKQVVKKTSQLRDLEHSMLAVLEESLQSEVKRCDASRTKNGNE